MLSVTFPHFIIKLFSTRISVWFFLGLRFVKLFIFSSIVSLISLNCLSVFSYSSFSFSKQLCWILYKLDCKDPCHWHVSLSVLKSYCYSLVMTTFFSSSSSLKFCFACCFCLRCSRHHIKSLLITFRWYILFSDPALYRLTLYFLLPLIENTLSFLCLLWSLKLSRLLETSLFVLQNVVLQLKPVVTSCHRP